MSELHDTELFCLCDLLARQSDPYYSKFGIEQVEQDSLDNITWTKVIQQFNSHYYEWALNGETLEQWQIRLQDTADRLLPTMSRRLTLYSNHEIDKVEMIGTMSMESTGTGSSSSNSKSIDTPDAKYNTDTAGYAGAVDINDSQSNDTRTTTTTHTSTPMGGVLTEVELNMDAWHDVIRDTVDGFRKCFLTMIYY